MSLWWLIFIVNLPEFTITTETHLWAYLWGFFRNVELWREDLFWNLAHLWEGESKLNVSTHLSLLLTADAIWPVPGDMSSLPWRTMGQNSVCLPQVPLVRYPVISTRKSTNTRYIHVKFKFGIMKIKNKNKRGKKNS